MGQIVLPYQIRWSPSGLEYLPLCNVVLLGKQRRVPVPAVVDSGAVFPIFPLDAARDAGIDANKGRPCSVIFGGSTESARLVDCFFEIGGHRLRSEVAFVREIKLGYALLGRRGVFSKFNEVAFIERWANSRVELRW